ncbi:hypothetical protein L218DRAFT_1081240 [Marasmius fiardii PR-910]|nr:hypothetical protein L218DRAFT_1081240 [Marasmius fiardii PR-910]
MAPTSTSHESLSDEWQVFLVRVINSFIITAFHFLLYGLYIPLFHTSIRLLAKRPPSPSRRYHQLSLITLFTLASVAVPLSSMFDVLHIASGFFSNSLPFVILQIDIQICRYVILFIIMLIVDSILIFRCFVIFGYRNKRYTPAIAVVLLVVVNLCGLIFSIWTEIEIRRRVEGDTSTPFHTIPQYIANGFVGLIALVNFTLTTILASRIWWISRKNRELQVLRGRHSADERIDRLKTVVAILLESGLLYLIMYIIFIIGNFAKVTDSFDTGSILIQVGGITPTLIFVRAAMNRPAEQESMTSGMNSQGQQMDYSRSIQIQSFTEIRDDTQRERKASETSSHFELNLRPSNGVTFPSSGSRLR